MAGFIGGRTSAFDYIGPELPNNPQNGEMWFDTDGASDGTGEVKVYDAESGAWEPTGFTSHADLTDVTRSAHHPPVEVSGPLTQPTDQSLGLSIGDGLADSNGTLVAALGNGLGIDGSGQVYIPANAVSQGMLGFDTATQSELNTHAGDASAHHTPPSSTVGTNVPSDAPVEGHFPPEALVGPEDTADGDINTGDSPGLAPGDYREYASNTYIPWEEVRIYLSSQNNSSVDVSITDENNNVLDSATFGTGDDGTWHTFNPGSGRVPEPFRIHVDNASDGYYVGISEVQPGHAGIRKHSHPV